MKRLMALLIIMAALAVAFLMGRHSGMNHVIMDSAVWLTNDAINLEIDGQWYTYDRM